MAMRIFATGMMVMLMLAGAGAAATDWRNEKLCTTKPVAFVEARQAGCVRSYCAKDTHAGELCACLPDDANDQLRITRRRGDTAQNWSAEVTPIQLESSSFHLQAFASSPNAGTPWLFAVRQGVSNGMGVSYWTAFVISSSGVSKPLELQELGALSLLTQAARNGPCRLLAGKWQEGYEPGRGGGTYFVASWHQPAAGQWQALSSLPTVNRRYLFAFERERLQGLGSDPAKPVLWFRHPATRPGDPATEPIKK